MKFIATPLEGLLIIEPKIYYDDRGYFFESFNEKIMSENNLPDPFVQDNQSISHKNVLRGLHFQRHPHQQGKLVRVIQGKAFDVAVDIRKNSNTFGKHFSIELSEKENTMLWIPVGFAHGFIALENDTVFSYKVTDYYNPGAESGIIFNDPDLGIDWKTSNPIVSQKDRILPSFREFRQGQGA
jgi:dTDP-4-dehydrorhamnose 3,5-epimerase